MELHLDRLSTPLGNLRVVVADDRLCALDYGDDETRLSAYLHHRYGTVTFTPTSNPADITQRLHAYFQGDYASLATIPVSPGGTPFQQRVWALLQQIPVGEVRSYGDLAQQLGQPTASRAVGLANARNPVAIVIPCHRVIGADAKLTGYAGGLDRKRWLLQHEGVTAEMERIRRSPGATTSPDHQLSLCLDP